MTDKRHFALLLLTSVLALLTPQAKDAQAGKNELGFDVIAGAALTFGGDEVAWYRTTVRIPGFPPYEGSSTVTAGGRAHLFLGGSFYTPSIPLRLQLTWGYLIDRTSDVDDLDSKFGRYPVEAALFFQKSMIRLGGGLSHQLSPTFFEDLDDRKFKFDNATGYFVEAGYIHSDVIVIGGRYTAIDYSHGESSTKLDGSNFGLYFTFLLNVAKGR
jgi:hypothetical protein